MPPHPINLPLHKSPSRTTTFHTNTNQCELNILNRLTRALPTKHVSFQIPSPPRTRRRNSDPPALDRSAVAAPANFLVNKRIDPLSYTSVTSTNITTISLPSIIDRNQIRADLYFISLTANSKTISALIDSGSAINVLSAELATILHYKQVNEPPHILVSCTGSKMSTLHWGTTEFFLSNGQIVSVVFAVVEFLPWQCILGLPFFHSSKLIADFANAHLSNNYGPIQLISKRQLFSLPTDSQPSTHSIPPLSLQPLSEDDKELFQQLDDKMKKVDVKSAESQLSTVLWEFKDLWSSKAPSACKILSHVIELTTPRPIVIRPRRHSLDRQEVIRKEVEQMEKDGIIRPSSSAYATEPVLVRKKDGPWRVCIDYRQLNKFTKTDRYPLPRISDLLRSLRNSTVFITLDLRAGYWNIRMDPKSAEYTAFRTPAGLYEFQVMPFGLVNAPATFQRVMDFIFGDLYDKGILIYLDDILIHSDSLEKMFILLRTVLLRLRHFGLRLNLVKSHFLLRELLYLGHMVSANQIRPNPQKVETLSRIRPPTSPPEVRKIMGLLSYFRQYIPSFADHSHHLTKLLQKNTPFNWTENHQFALEYCLHHLASSVLALPLEDDNFVLETDASDYAAGAILSVRREGRLVPIEFASTTFKGPEIRWPTREKEGYAVFWALNKFDHYLRGRSFDVFTDHESLLHMTRATSGKLARWSCRLAEYNFTLHHKSGTQMDHVDFFSRFVADEHDLVEDRMTYLPLTPDVKSPCLATNSEALQYDPTILTTPVPFPSYAEIVQAQHSYSPSPSGKQFSNRNGVWFYNSRLWIPPPFRSQVIAACHLVPPYRHLGHKKTQKSIQATCNWPNLHQEVANFIRSCLICQRLRPQIEHFQGQLLHQPPVSTLFEQVHIDHWGPCRWAEGNPVVLTIIDCLGRWCECVVIKSTGALETAEAFLNNWMCRYGVPNVVISDKGPAFWSDIFNRISSLLGITHLRSTVRHPEGNALVESFHRTLKKNISSIHLQNKSISFETSVQLAAYSYRSSIHLTLGDSPAFITFGIDLRPPIESDWRFLRHPEDAQRSKVFSEIRLQQIERAHAQFVLLSQLDQPGRTHDLFQVGDIVLVNLSESEITRYTRVEGDRKIAPKFSMPARVVQVLHKGKTAVVRHLGSGRTQEVHIQHARFISLPQCPILRQQWIQLAASHAESTLTNPQLRELYVLTFWGDMVEPQRESIKISRPRKRVRPD